MKTIDDEFPGESLIEDGKKVAHVIETRFGWVFVTEVGCDGLYKTRDAAVAAATKRIVSVENRTKLDQW